VLATLVTGWTVAMWEFPLVNGDRTVPPLLPAALDAQRLALLAADPAEVPSEKLRRSAAGRSR
jgi:hypothetical protein